MSWLVQRDVDEGRDRLNFSEWGQGEQEVDDVGETIREGEMPPVNYVLLHPQAKLSAQEKGALISGLAASIGVSGGEHEGEEDDDDD